MAKPILKRQKAVRKTNSMGKRARHHWFLISIFIVIIVLGVTAFILQRSINITAIAGEAIRQRVAETKQLAWSDEEVKVAAAIELGKKDVTEKCPLSLKSSLQPLVLEGNWKFKDLQVVEVQCGGNTITCYYADSESEINRADQVVIYNSLSRVKNCKIETSENFLGCKCEIS